MTHSIDLLGATGSIGQQTLAVCRMYPQIRINTAAADKNYQAIMKQLNELLDLAETGLKKIFAIQRKALESAS